MGLENNLTISPCSKRTQICKNLKLKSSRSKKLTCSERKQSSGQSMSSEDADSNNHHSSVSDDSVKTKLYSNKNGVDQGNGKVELARDAVLETSSSDENSKLQTEEKSIEDIKNATISKDTYQEM